VNRLQRHIGPVGLLFVSLGGVIGSGWLFAALYAAQIAGPAAVVSWLIGGLIALVLALVYGELGAMLPVAGGLARFPHFTHGGLVSFVGGWLCWLGYVTTAPIEVLAVLEYLGNLLPWLDRSVGGERVLTTGGTAAALTLLGLFTVLNMIGVRLMSDRRSAARCDRAPRGGIRAFEFHIARFRAQRRGGDLRRGLDRRHHVLAVRLPNGDRAGSRGA
jgi:amino acid transporter